MLDWLAAIPNLGVPGVPGVPPQKSAISEGGQGVPAGVPGVPARCSGTPGTPSRTPENDSKSLKYSEEHREHREHRISDNPTAVLRDWHGHLVRLDACRAPHGYELGWWQQAVDDACFVYEGFASQAVRGGWSALDLFGVLPHEPKYGGLGARLAGARNLKMSGPKATWSSWGVQDWTCAGAGEGLTGSGIKLLWDLVDVG